MAMKHSVKDTAKQFYFWAQGIILALARKHLGSFFEGFEGRS